MKRQASAALAAIAALCGGVHAQEIVPCGAGSYASYTPWIKAKTVDGSRGGDQSRFMQTRPLYMTARRKGEPIPTNDWWTDALVSRWTGNLWSYPAKVRIGADGVRVASPTYWIENGTEMKERGALVFGAAGDFDPQSADVDDWHDWDVSLVLRDGEKEIKATLVHGSPFTWIEYKGVEPAVKSDEEGGSRFIATAATKSGDGGLVGRVALNAPDGGLGASRPTIIDVAGDLYGVWPFRRDGGAAFAVAPLPDRAAFKALTPYAHAAIRSTRVDWRYDEAKAELVTTWNVETEDLRGGGASAAQPVALQGFQPHHLKKTRPAFKTVEGLVWETPRGKQRVAAGNSLSVAYDFPGMLPYWAVPNQPSKPSKHPNLPNYRETLFRDLVADYAARGSFGGDTYWGGKGLLQMAFAMMAARELGDGEAYQKAHDRLRAKFEDWLTWTPGEERFYFSYVPRWGGLVGESTSYDSDAFNDHHFHYGYFTYAGALLCMADADFAEKFGPMLRLVARDYANWERPATAPSFPLFRTFDPWAGHSFAGGVGDWNGNGQESSSEAMQGWGGLYLLGLALGDDAMRDAGIFGYVSEARAVAEYWFDRDRENIDYSKFKHPYNSNLTCHGVGWWTYFSGDPVWMHSIQWLPNTPALDYLSEDLKFAKWDWDTMWKTKEIGGWYEKGKDRNGNPTDCVGDASLGNVLLSYLQRHDPAQAAEIFDRLREKRLGAAMNADTAHMTYWATHSHLAYGELDFSVRADYPCARAYARGASRVLMAYNVGSEPRKVRFFDASGETVGELDAAPRCLTVSVDGKIGGRCARAVGVGLPERDSANPEGAARGRAACPQAAAGDESNRNGRAACPQAAARRVEGNAPYQPLVPSGVAMPDLALGKPTRVSSQENGGMPGSNMTDGDDKTRWGSDHHETDLTAAVDLGETVELYGAELKWENSHASRFLFQISPDGAKWTDLGGERTGFEGLQRLDFNGEKARWVRVKGLAKATQYGISLFRFSVYGKPKSAKPGAPLGLKIEADRAVLKEGEPCRVSAKAWLGGDRFRPADASWSSDDGKFNGRAVCPQTAVAEFTPESRRVEGNAPHQAGFATVTAEVGGLKVSRRFPVEEALRTATLKFAQTNLVAVVGEGVKVKVSATDQFGGKLRPKDFSISIREEGVAAKTKNAELRRGGLFFPKKAGRYVVEARAGGLKAECRVAAVPLAEANLARLAAVTASGEENGGLSADKAADGDPATRWSSRHRDGEWIAFDFGKERTVSRLDVRWENARAEHYVVEVSDDGAKWKRVAEMRRSAGGLETLTWPAVKTRRLRIVGLSRNTDYGISIFEVEIH